MDDGFVDVYSTATGKKHRVPAHFMTNPRLSRPFRKTPKATAAETRALGSATPGTDVVTTTPENPTPSTTETPAAGD
ncbi:hypothetical protein [Nocardioides sp. PD653]|uniref:hypothetical protein n=1 Tax=Nocardioides sp. PD653 TaxID=393303 RepID=UPI0009F12DC7|nr:hypothetical protein [Nocardioides sp. PD653]GAW54745.1 uncharacterized protein PD653_2159 [Nocardioides sp. PD653]